MEGDNGGERYERFVFDDATEDDYIVSDILVNFETLIHNNSTQNSQPQPLVWHNKRKRSVLDDPPSPPRTHHAPPRIETREERCRDEDMRIKVRKTKREEFKTDSPSSTLSPIEAQAPPAQHYTNNLGSMSTGSRCDGSEKNPCFLANNNIHSEHHSEKKSSKRKPEELKEHIEKLEQTKRQLQRSLDAVRRYHQTLLELNAKLKAKRDEKNYELERKNPQQQVNRGFDLNIKLGPHQFTSIYYPVVPYYQVNNDKSLKAAEAAQARRNRKMKLDSKKRSGSLGIRSIPATIIN